jgi:hypothetical protein
MRIPRHLLAALALLGATACGSAAAAPLQPAPVPKAPLASVRMVSRLAAAQETMIPSVLGLSVRHARQRLEGLEVSVVAVGRASDPISAQWPPAGDPRPADNAVILWVGTPPQAQPVARPPEATQTLTTAPEGLPVTTPAAAPAPAPAAAPAAAPAPDTAVSSGVTPGLENMVAPPHPPRANIRTLPAEKPGTTLSGRASWYGPGFAGRTTACGGVFNPAELTLASRELRCGTSVTVTGPGGRSVTATVTDWGPAEWTGRRFDLSQGTFAAVAGLGAGVIDVTVTVN